MEFIAAATRLKQNVIIDESFIEFAGDGDASVASDLVRERHSNVIVVKSLSKSLGVPGLRLGYCLSGNEDWISRLNAMIPIWNTNSIAQYMLEMLPKYRNELEASFVRTREDRNAFCADLEALELIRPLPSGGNYVLCRLDERAQPGDELARALLSEHGILIKDCSAKFRSESGQYVRFAVRTREDHRTLLRALQATLKTLT
jgi:histidinol-phosphate/aromatic aminotransferase/cobyric acid decarboxylase-like protein